MKILSTAYGTRIRKAAHQSNRPMPDTLAVLDNPWARHIRTALAQADRDAGATILASDTYAPGRLVLKDRALAGEVIGLQLRLLRAAVAESAGRVKKLVTPFGPALDWEPGASSPPSLSAAEYRDYHAEVLSLLDGGGKSGLWAETIGSTREAQGIAAAFAQRMTPNDEAVISFHVDGNGDLAATGEELEEAIHGIRGVTSARIGIGLNCGSLEGIENALRKANVDRGTIVAVYPNASSEAFTVLNGAAEKGKVYSVEDRADFSHQLQRLTHHFGIQIIGVCCGGQSADIHALRERASDRQDWSLSRPS